MINSIKESIEDSEFLQYGLPISGAVGAFAGAALGAAGTPSNPVLGGLVGAAVGGIGTPLTIVVPAFAGSHAAIAAQDFVQDHTGALDDYSLMRDITTFSGGVTGVCGSLGGLWALATGAGALGVVGGIITAAAVPAAITVGFIGAAVAAHKIMESFDP